MIFAMVNLSAQNLTVAETVDGSTTNGWVKWNTGGLNNPTMTGTTTINGTTYTVTASWSGGTRLHHSHLQALLDAGGDATWVSNATSNTMPSGLSDKNRHGLYLQNSPYATTNTTITLTISPAASIARFNVADAENDAAKTTLYWNEDYTITGANMTDYHVGGYLTGQYGTPTATANSLSIPTTYRDENRYAEEYVYHGKGSTSTTSITWSLPGNNIGSDYEEFSGVALALQLMEPCVAGSSAPSLNSAPNLNVASSVLTIPCGSSTANLTSLTASNQPSGTTMTWHTSADASASNLVSNPNSVGTGTYYAAFYDSANSCYSTSSTQLTVVAESDCCDAGNIAPSVN